MGTFAKKSLIAGIILLLFLLVIKEAEAQTGNLTGTVTNCNTGVPMAGVIVSCGILNAVTNASGVYTISGISAGTQMVTATMAGFLPYGPVPVTIIGNQTTTLNFCMTQPLAPTVVTLPATNVGTTTATMNGTVNPNNYSATTFFEWGLTVAYGLAIPGVPSPVTGNIPCAFTASITGLATCHTYHYRAKATNAVGTTYGADMTFTPGGSAGPAGPITGPTNICPGGWGYVYSISPIAGATGYIWTLPAGFTITSGANTSLITVNVSPGTVSGYVTVYGTSGCGNGAPSSLWVTIGNSIPPTITGNNNVCNKTVVTYSTQPGMATYYWSVSPGGTVLSGGGSTDSTITISWILAGSRYIKLSYSSGTGCTSPIITYAVTVKPSPTPTITGPASLCNNLTGTYMTEAGMTNYNWMVSAGGIITSGAGTRTITVHWVSSGSKTISVNYLNSSGCSAQIPTVKNVTVNALPVPTITGPNSVCLNAYAYYSTEAGMSNYTWTLGGSGGIIYSGFNSRQIQVKWTMNGAKTVSVNYTNTNGCQAATPTVLNVNVHTCPSPSLPSVKSAEVRNFNITLFPNPNDGTFTLSLDFPEKQYCNTTVYNLTGIKVYESGDLLIDGTTEQKIDLGSVPEGVYMVIVQSRDKCITRKILVVH
ncbi:MAG: carboxypeptidase regulatory-like domain-containing protein [Bacteroidetes bacterium]|nr:carboxypeptidase regulatory-like domain-containing protein [Bacteroidota bacterium]